MKGAGEPCGGPPADSASGARNIRPEPGLVSRAQRQAILRQHALTVWITGLPGSGKSTLAKQLERRLTELGRACFVLDGDNLRHGLNRDLGFSPEERRENIRRAAEVCRLMNDAGLIVAAAFVSPYRDHRAMARAVVGAARFMEVHAAADLATCERRDPKGLYARARRREISDFTGVSGPYEAPTAPALALDTAARSVESCVEELVRAVAAREEMLGA